MRKMVQPASRSLKQSTRSSVMKLNRPESAPSHLGGGESMYSTVNSRSGNNVNRKVSAKREI